VEKAVVQVSKQRTNPIVGSFFLSSDKTELFHIAGEVSTGYFLVEGYRGTEVISKQVLPVHRISGLQLYPSLEAAQSAGGGK
jgi:hypothetical protein